MSVVSKLTESIVYVTLFSYKSVGIQVRLHVIAVKLYVGHFIVFFQFTYCSIPGPRFFSKTLYIQVCLILKLVKKKTSPYPYSRHFYTLRCIACVVKGDLSEFGNRPSDFEYF